MENSIDTPAKRSGFVTGLAWTFIVLAGFTALLAVLLNVLLNVLISPENMRFLLQEADKTASIPPAVRFTLVNFQTIVVALLALCAVTIVASIGLLKRMNWARQLFIAMMALAVLAHLAALALPFFMPDLMPATSASSDLSRQFGLILKAVMVLSLVSAVVFAWAYWWLMKRLMAEDIKAEFVTR